MKTLLLLFAAFVLPNLLSAQSDILPTNDGPVTMTPVQHASVVLQWKDRTIYIDPAGGAGLYASFKKPDMILITHAHGDHFNKETLGGLDLSSAEFIGPESVTSDIGDMKFNKITTLDNTSGVARTGVRVEAMPMYNLPEDETSRHKRGWGNAYVITIGGTKLYFSGDTEDIAEMRSLQNIDYAFICMNLPYTMTVEQAADAVLEFKPKVVYPYHYRGQNGLSDVDKFKALVGKDPAIEVRLRNWYQ